MPVQELPPLCERGASQAGSGGAPALVTAGSEQLELGSLHGTLQADALL